MTSLQLGLIIGGVVLVVGVIIYNWITERRLREKIAARTEREAGSGGEAPRGARRGRVEPTLARGQSDDRVSARSKHVAASGPPLECAEDEEFEPAVEILQSQADDFAEEQAFETHVAASTEGASSLAL